MSGKPTGVVILAILQLLGALAALAIGALALMAFLIIPIFSLFAIFALIPFFIGIIGLILFYGLWTLKSWAWLWTLVVNIIQILVSIMDPINNIITIAISLIIVIYLFMPATKAHFR
ncbi:MAG: hypothetical protein ACXAAO_04465 [Candidatus Thorarchaeota archaeon]|jgi:hypothetical protein